MMVIANFDPPIIEVSDCYSTDTYTGSGSKCGFFQLEQVHL